MKQQTELEIVKQCEKMCPVCEKRPVVEYLRYRSCSLECDDILHTIDFQFKKFHERNPEVYREIVKLARTAKRRGIEKLGIGMIFEVLRWRKLLDTTADRFKLSNNFRSRYARLVMEQEPDLQHIFDIRHIDSKFF